MSVSDQEISAVRRYSAFCAEWLDAQAGRFEELHRSGALEGAPEIDARQLADDAAAAASAAECMRLLRRWRNERLFLIAWRDLVGGATLEETLTSLSDLADAAIEAALVFAERELEERYGTPRTEEGEAQRMIVIGMGKLGGRELNFSSDIDLIFAYRRDAETDGRRRVPAAEYYKRLARELVGLLSEQTADGFVFRVDTRLRPFGDAGALVASLPAMESYYQAHGREWERYAWIKARPVAGDMAGGKRVLEMLRPFVYRRYLDYGAFESIRDMKALINRQVASRGLEDNVKLGGGGIREVEFIAQAFQLIRGGHEPALQDNRLLPTLVRLAEAGHLPEHAADDLEAAYRFLRRAENRLQMWRDQQTHELPREEARRAALAESMGHDDWESFAAALSEHRRKVRDAFEQVFASPHADDEPGEGARILALWEEDLDAGQTERALADYGMRDPESVVAALDRLRDDALTRAMGDRGRRWVARLLPLLFAAAANTEEPDRAVIRGLDVLQAITGRATYIALLVEHPAVLSSLVRLCAASSWITEQIKSQPVLLDSLLDPRMLYRAPDYEELRAGLAEELAVLPEDDLERRMDVLRRFRQASVLRVAAADVTESMPLMVVSDHLTAVAEVVLSAALDIAWSQMVARYGKPVIRGGERDGEIAGFAAIGYGKLGGFELGYASDLDLVFLFDSPGDQSTDGDRSLSHQAFFLRLAQRLVHVLSTQTGAGRAYEVDMRLRPSGQSGLLVSHIDGFAAYQRDKAWTWEHQALVRARPVAGEQALGERFHALREEILSRPRDKASLRREVTDMRRRMRENLDRSGEGSLDLKQTAGGLIDIEFLAQYAVLRHAHECRELMMFTDTIRILETLESGRLLDYESTKAVTDAYRAYRMRVHAAALQQTRAMIGDDELTAEREAVRRLWRDWLGPADADDASGSAAGVT